MMRKTQKMLAFVLTVTMLLSCIGAMGVSAAVYPETNSFFCDFEDFELAGFTTMTASNFTSKGFAYAGSDTGASASGTYFSIKSDSTQGKYLSLYGKMGLDVSLPTAITEGMAKLSFSYKVTGSTGPYIKALESSSTTDTSSWAASATPSSPRIGGFNAGSNMVLDRGYGGYNDRLDLMTVTSGTWNRVDFIFDITNNRWTMYLNGTWCETWAEGVADGVTRSNLSKIGAFRIFSNASSPTSETASEVYAIDDISLTIYEDDDTFDVIGASIDEENKTVKVILSEDLETTVSASDITMALCGDATTAVAIDTVSQLNNKVTFTYTGTLLPGREYEIKLSENVESVYGRACGNSGFVNATIAKVTQTLVPLQTFENITATTVQNSSNQSLSTITDATVAGILHRKGVSSPYDTYSKATGTAIHSVGSADGEEINSTSASGNALRPKIYTEYNFLYPVDVGNMSGVITYEFDAMYYYTSGLNMMAYYVDSATGTVNTKLVGDFAADKKWHHYKITYDTTTGDLNMLRDGSDWRGTTAKNNSKGLTTFTGQLSLSTDFGSRILAIDNYTCYNTYTPFAVKSVRYVDSTGKANGSSSITPETTQINVTFTEAVDDAAISNIVLKKGNVVVTPEDVDVSADGLTVKILLPEMLCGESEYTLTIPASVKAESGNALSGEIVYEFETTEGKFEISSFEASGSDLAGGTTSGGTLTLSADVLNTEGGEKNFVLLYAYYNDDQLVDVNKAEVTIPDGTYYKDISAPFTIDSGIAYDEVKIFIWDSLKNAKPYLPAVKYPQ